MNDKYPFKNIKKLYEQIPPKFKIFQSFLVHSRKDKVPKSSNQQELIKIIITILNNNNNNNKYIIIIIVIIIEFFLNTF